MICYSETEAAAAATALTHSILPDIPGTSSKRAAGSLVSDRKIALIKKVKSIIVEMIRPSDKKMPANHSQYISNKIKYHYTYISNLFSDVMGVTIQQYIIALKIERVKEMMLYEKMNLSEISDKMEYSSLAHLSSQFKKVTGHSPSVYKKVALARPGVAGHSA